MINKILEKIINPEKVITKLMLLAGSFILILNQFTLEYLLFPESAVMCLGVFFNVIAIKFMVDNPKCKYIKIFLALLVAVFCYQGVLNMFPVLAILVYIVKQIVDKREYKVKEKEFFVEMIKLAFIVIVQFLLLLQKRQLKSLLQFEQFRQKKQKMQFVHCLLPKQKKQCLFLLITLIKLFAITIPAIAITATNKISIKQSS